MVVMYLYLNDIFYVICLFHDNYKILLLFLDIYILCDICLHIFQVDL